MPIYEYKCRKCGRLTSVFQKTLNSSPNTRCKACGSKQLERVISGFAYHRSESAILDDYGSEPKRLEAGEMPDDLGDGDGGDDAFAED